MANPIDLNVQARTFWSCIRRPQIIREFAPLAVGKTLFGRPDSERAALVALIRPWRWSRGQVHFQQQWLANQINTVAREEF